MSDQKRLAELEAQIHRLKQKLSDADCLLGDYGAGGSAGGTIPAIHNLAHKAEKTEALQDRYRTALEKIAASDMTSGADSNVLLARETLRGEEGEL